MLKKTSKPLKYVLISAFILFIFSVIPLYYIGTFAHPSADDYSYGISAFRSWTETNSLQAVLKTASEKTVDKYNNWQGNFAAVFLMYLQPGIFGEEFYILTPILLLTAFITSTLLFYYTVFTKILKGEKALSALSTLIMVFFILQSTYMPSDSFYWYNGAIYYTFFYSLSLVLYTMLINAYNKKNGAVGGIMLLISSLLSFLIGGSNYSTALLNAILLFFTVACFIYKKNRFWIYCLPIFVSGLFGLFISMLGPGNLVRQSSIGSPHNPLFSILLSFVYGGYSIANATSVPILFFWFLMIPIFWKFLNKMHYRFDHPLPILFITFCIYSAQITPVIYAQGIRIPYRIMNIVYFNYFPFVALNLYYFLGYIRQKNSQLSLPAPFSHKLYFTSMIFSILIFSLGSIHITEGQDGSIELSNLPFTASAVYSLVTKEAEAYDKQAKERIEILKKPGSSHVVLSPFTYKPYVIFHSDITTDVSFWKNRHLADYYKKKTIRLAHP